MSNNEALHKSTISSSSYTLVDEAKLVAVATATLTQLSLSRPAHEFVRRCCTVAVKISAAVLQEA